MPRPLARIGAATPVMAVVEGTQGVLKEAGIDVFVHGTTLATNAVIERKGERTALIATDGFRDVIEIADESRYDPYDIFIDKPRQLVRRHCGSLCLSASMSAAHGSPR